MTKVSIKNCGSVVDNVKIEVMDSRWYIDTLSVKQSQEYFVDSNRTIVVSLKEAE